MAGLVARERVRTDAAECVCEGVDVQWLDLVGLDDDLAISLVERDSFSRSDLELVSQRRSDIREHEEDGLAGRNGDLAGYELEMVVHADDDHPWVRDRPD